MGRGDPLGPEGGHGLWCTFSELITNDDDNNSNQEPEPGALRERFPVFSFITLGHWGGENGV